ncbi:MAG TPA: hypothetical protein VK524_07085, partial [Polyangiaceae bacterium]|nr:hypothetical protein [Polyangiaceae bacterium]
QSGGIHLTGLFLLAPYLTEQNAGPLLDEARGASRQQIEHLLARRFPRPDIEGSHRPDRQSAGTAAPSSQAIRPAQSVDRSWSRHG